MKILSIVAVAFATFLFSNVNGQIVYTDIPDGIPAGIDFNSDGNNEFDIDYLFAYEGVYLTYYDYGLDNNVHAIGSFPGGNWDVPACVAAGFTVDETNNWEGMGDCIIVGLEGNNPTLTSGQDQYLAVKFNFTGAPEGSDFYYGWIRFSWTDDIITYKDYAYNATPNTPINTGDKGSTTGINDFVQNNKFVIYPNPAKNTINVNNTSDVKVTDIKIMDVTGKEVKSISVSNSSNQAVDISDLTAGVYVINIFNSDVKIAQNKIIVE